MYTNYQSKDELLQRMCKELEAKERDIENLHAEIDKLNRQKEVTTAANEVKVLFDAYINAGFTGFEALQLVSSMVSGIVRANVK